MLLVELKPLVACIYRVARGKIFGQIPGLIEHARPNFTSTERREAEEVAFFVLFKISLG